jgi:DNA-binding transcriptional LysR family regulator
MKRRDEGVATMGTVMDWDKLRVFHAVAEAGSFTHAGDALNLSQSAVSRQISALEEALQVHLFHRHARGLKLTEQGELLHRTAREVFAKLSVTEALLSESKEHPKGPLKVTTTFAFGANWLAPRLREFCELYPDIHITLLIDDSELDLAMREADVAIRMLPPKQADLVQRLLFKVQFHLYASPAYIEKYGAPKSVEELKKHTLIAFPPGVPAPFPQAHWLLEVAGITAPEPPNVLFVNNVYAMFRIVESGMGISALPDFLIEGSTQVQRILPDVNGPEVAAYFVYAEELRPLKRITVFRDFLVKKVATTTF